MRTKANPALIGLFVIVAVAITAAAILTLGSGRIFRDSVPYVLYFEGNLSGLDEGAPVSFQGVQVGAVTDISIVYDHATDEISRPVRIEVLPDVFVQQNIEGALTLEEAMPLHVERGLRAQLVPQSLVTGKQKVSFGYFPETEAQYHAGSDDVPEVPTVPAVFDTLTRRFEALPIEEIVMNANDAVAGLSLLLNSGEIDRTLKTFNVTLEEARGLMASPELREAIVSLNATLQNLERVTASEKIPGTLEAMDQTLTETREAVQELRDTVARLGRDVAVVLDGMVDVTRSARSLIDQLERQPESLLRGKRGGFP